MNVQRKKQKCQAGTKEGAALLRIFKYVTAIMTLLVCFFTGNIDTAYAAQNTIESIEVYVSINEDGSATITEHRVENIFDGTEKYIVKEDLGKSTIEDFVVTEGGQTYEYTEPWNIDASREEKAFKNGIIKTKNGYELAWGIGEYGRHEYTIQYTVTNFIKQLKDSQMLFWNFISEQAPPERIYVEIETVKRLTNEDESIWAFGYPGDIHFVDGKIIAKSTEPLLADDQVIILVQFRDEIFSTGDKVNKKFNAIQKQAFKGSDYSLSESSSGTGFFGFIFSVIKSAFQLLFYGILLAAFLFIYYKFRGTNVRNQRRKFQRRYKEEYYRDFPYEGFFMDAYHIVYVMGLSDFKTIFTALLLKWIKEDRIRIDTIDKSGIFRKANSQITILDDNMDGSTLEGKLFSYLQEAAGKKNQMSDSDLSKWANRNYSKLYHWETEVMKASQAALEKRNYLISEEKKVWMFSKKSYALSQSGEEVEKNVYKYVNYLNDFSLLHEHEAINVKIWDDIMIWAAYINLTDVVMKQFEKLYPKYFETSVYNKNTLAHTTAVAERTERSRHEAQQKARSSGSGGSASRGGGGGAYGGGGRGGTR